MLIFYTVALFIGMAKTGVHGSGMVAVPLLASVFGGQLSSGIMLPILIFADCMGVWYYHQHASWSHLKKLFPWAAGGILLGTVAGDHIPDQLFRGIMAVIIFISVGIMIWFRQKGKDEVPTAPAFVITTGIMAGFTSMIGNLAGSVMAVYLLSMRLPKNEFIGTAAWFFLILNVFKLPFHIFWWKTITLPVFLMDLTTIPVIALGAIAGIFIVKNVSEKTYRTFIIVMTLIAAIMMLR
jgi:uncharacterized protein